MLTSCIINSVFTLFVPELSQIRAGGRWRGGSLDWFLRPREMPCVRPCFQPFPFAADPRAATSPSSLTAFAGTWDLEPRSGHLLCLLLQE